MNPQTANENLNEVEATENEGVLSASVTKKITDPFTNKEIKAKGNYSLPLATSLETLNSLSGGKIEETIFWFNYGRKVAARAQVAAKLDFDLGSDSLNASFKSFTVAMAQILGKDASEERQKLTKDFILSQPQFSALSEALKNYSQGDVNVDFSSEELKKPSGKRGRPGSEENSAE